ncbi:MAG: cytochrome C oxidase subunit IV family protein [Ilumatobacter sp.]|jgi:caa(3)-type oxidase subunit IV|nr:cytochrome C oxidase subunit IV family protein [Ilumatobacter sp.]MDG1696026.1 cytochrome C oxidase subunit IV family protein [Ilumatobacter sp.]MDG2439146.1 cytochrome C oxidase subunit IV family protein [Ilumatobacter sp.]
MTDTLDTTPTHDVKHDNHHGPTDKQFIAIFFFLAAITAIEVLVSYIDIGPAFLPVLLGLMVVKFFAVVWYFMHVKFDHQLFGRLFYIGLGLAVFVYIVMLSTFRFFAG